MWVKRATTFVNFRLTIYPICAIFCYLMKIPILLNGIKRLRVFLFRMPLDSPDILRMRISSQPKNTATDLFIKNYN